MPVSPSRRSSMTVLTLTVKKTERRKRKYFPRCDVTPQSRTAVHYLVGQSGVIMWSLVINVVIMLPQCGW